MKYQSQEYFEYYIMSVNKGTKIRLGEEVQVADRRRWQSAMTSPIGDVGSERVKADTKSYIQLPRNCCRLNSTEHSLPTCALVIESEVTLVFIFRIWKPDVAKLVCIPVSCMTIVCLFAWLLNTSY